MPAVTTGPEGFTPTQIREAYGFAGVQEDGAGQTIAIVDAYDDPTISSDLNAFDAAFGLPAPPSFERVAQNGSTNYPPTDPAGPGNANGTWEEETALDVEWAHAMAPGASLLLVEANNATTLYTAVGYAKQQPGVSAVVMSFYQPETSSSDTADSIFTTPSGHIGVTFVGSSGDYGAYGEPNTTSYNVDYPAASPNVLGVGGTELSVDANGNYASETGWGNSGSSDVEGGSGGGISSYEAQPSWQSGIVTQSSAGRAVPDVSFDADPATGVAVYDSYDFGTKTPWIEAAGTSLGAPAWAGIIADINQGRVADGETELNGQTQTNQMLYSLPESDFHDITTGNNGYAAGTGYDLVTGRGTLIANLLIPAMIGTPTPIIVDNTQATLVGTWTASTYTAGYYGSNYITDGDTDKGGKSATFTPDLPASGSYEVLARWTTGSNRATDVPFIITDASGTTTVTENEQIDNGTWESLGTYTFNAGTSGNVKISNAGTNGYVIADAVEFIPVSAPPIIVDTTQAKITGSWVTSTYTPGYYGPDYIDDGDTGKGSKSVTFTPDIPTTGTYSVLARWTGGANRATNVPFAVSSASGSITEDEDEQIDGGEWILLGTFTFDSGTGGSVTISNTGTNGYVIADAVEFLPV